PLSDRRRPQGPRGQIPPLPRYGSNPHANSRSCFDPFHGATRRQLVVPFPAGTGPLASPYRGGLVKPSPASETQRSPACPAARGPALPPVAEPDALDLSEWAAARSRAC